MSVKQDGVPAQAAPAQTGGTPAAAQAAPLCWPFPPGSQNHTDKAVRLKPYVPPKRRAMNQF